MSSTYNKIKSLSAKLRDEPKVTQRRALAKELQGLLRDHHVRQSLENEAGRNKRQALSVLWRLVIGNALFSVMRVHEGRSKLTKEDIELPHQLLICCHESFLSSKDVIDLLHYCLNMLADDEAVALAELDLLKMLCHLCSRPEYVGYFRPHIEINNILAELQKRLENPENEGKSALDTLILSAAAKSFAAILKSCQTLGVGLHVIMSSCMEVVYDWCDHQLKLKAPRQSSILHHMIGAATTLLTSHPEQAVALLSRNGRRILKFVIRSYPQSQSLQKDSLVEYILAHLLVCQTAGRLQGLLPGDLGDVGNATLDAVKIELLLSMVASDAELEKFVAMGVVASTKAVSKPPTTGRTQARVPTATSRGSRSQVLWNPVGQRLRIYLELCARLFACSQRLYLANVEWNAIETPINELDVDILEPENEGLSRPPKELEPCPALEWIKSPWVQRVAYPLRILAGFDVGESPVDVPASQNTACTATSTLVSPHLALTQFSDILTQMSVEGATPPKSVIPLLQIICACAELFPLGECWTSSTQHYWYTHKPKDVLLEDITYCNGCSPYDMALVVYLVSGIFEAYGGTNGDHDIQTWCLLCLIRLAESSTLVRYASAESGRPAGVLPLVWQQVCRIMFRSDLRYVSYTGSAVRDSLGELVLVLLTEIVRQGCTETSMNSKDGIVAVQSDCAAYLHSNQELIWNLPVFSNAEAMIIPPVFELAIAVLHFAGLTDDGKDSIDHLEPRYVQPDTDVDRLSSIRKSSRRYRLLCFCLRYVHYLASFSGFSAEHRETVAVASACIGSLITGKIMFQSSTFAIEGSLGRDSRLTSVAEDGTRGLLRFSVTHMSQAATGFGVDEPDLKIDHASYFRFLWDFSALDEFQKFDRTDDLIVDPFSAVTGVILAGRFVKVWSIERLKNSEDFVSTAESSSLQAFALACLVPFPAALEQDAVESEGTTPKDDFSSTECSSIAHHAIGLKVLMTAAVSDSDGALFRESQMQQVAAGFTSFVDDLLILINRKEDLCAAMMTDLLHVLHAFTAISLTGDGEIFPGSVGDRLSSLFDVCEKLLEEYGRSVAAGSNVGLHPTAQRNSKYDSDADSCWEEEPQRESNEGKRRVPSGTDSDSDSFVGRKKKRRKMAQSSGDKERLRMGTSFHVSLGRPLSFPVAAKLASIMILLKPSYEVCIALSRSLAFHSGGDERQRSESDGSRGLDVRGACHCLNLFVSMPVILYRRGLRSFVDPKSASAPMMNVRPGESVIRLCCELIQAICATSGQESLNILHGFRACIGMIRHGEPRPGGESIGTIVCNEIASILQVDDSRVRKRIMNIRPLFRSLRLQAATMVFRLGGRHFHDSFDRLYPQEFVVPSLCDVSESVRKQGGSAVGIALRFLDETKVVSEVTKTLPPISSEKSAALVELRRWYEDKSLGFRVASDELEVQVWEDALISLESGAVECRGIITGSSSNAHLYRSSLFALVQTASERPDLEGLCFLAGEKAAALKGFESLDAMVRDECEYLCHRWLQTGKELAKMPLMMSSPSLLWRLLRTGQGSIRSASGPASNLFNGDALAEMQQLRVDAACCFVERVPHLLVPIMLASIAESTSVVKARISETVEFDSNQRDIDPTGYLQQVAQFLTDDRDDGKSIQKILRAHVHDVQAFAQPMVCSSVPERKSLGQGIVRLLQSKLSEEVVEKKKSENAHLAIRRLFELWGKYEHGFGMYDISEHDVEKAIHEMALQGGDSQSAEDIFQAVGSSVTECLLYSKFWLGKAVLVAQKESRWRVIAMICGSVVNRIQLECCEGTQAEVCIHILLDVLADESLLCVHHMAICALKDLVSCMIDRISSVSIQSELSAILYKLVGTLFLVHERCQHAIIGHCNALNTIVQQSFLRSLGLMEMISDSNFDSDSWGWNARDCNGRVVLAQGLREPASTVPDAIRQSTIDTYNVIEILMQHWPKFQRGFGVSTSSLGRFASTTTYDALCEISEQLCAQKMVRCILEAFQEQEEKNIGSDIADFLSFTYTLRMNHRSMQSTDESSSLERSSANEFYTTGNSLNITGRLLMDQLEYLNRNFHRHRTDRHSENLASDKEKYQVARELRVLCGIEYPEEIRSAASRCIGEIGYEEICNLSHLETELTSVEHFSEVDISMNGSNALQRIQLTCLELLSEYLISPRVQTALTALQCSKAILSMKNGSDFLKSITGARCKRLLRPLIRSCSRIDDLRLPDHYIGSLIAKTGCHLESAKAGNDWCWHQNMWTCVSERDRPYDAWIRDVVCAMICCCYVAADDQRSSHLEKVRGTGKFFRFCITMCALEHDFAARAFPGIILDFLLSSVHDAVRNTNVDHSLDGYGTDHDTWLGQPESAANRKLSASFATLIRHGSADIKALALAIDTLDILRKITHHRFLSSQNHKRNPSTNPKRLYPEQTRNKQGEQANHMNSNEYNLDLDFDHNPMRGGIPYGTVLRLDGLQVVRACLAARRFASGLFYADMYSDKCFGGSGGAIERLSQNFLHGHTSCYSDPVVDISGFVTPVRIDAREDYIHVSRELANNRSSFPDLLKQCFAELREYDAVGAVELENASMQFLRDDFKWSSNVASQPTVSDRLRALDAQCANRAERGQTSLSIVACMEDIGLRHVLRTYIDGLVSKGAAGTYLVPSEIMQLRDSWFREALQEFQWDDELLTSSTLFDPSPVRDEGFYVSNHQPQGRLSAPNGFHESLFIGLGAFLRDDTESFRTSLQHARASVLYEISAQGDAESVLSGMVEHAERSQILNDLECLTNVISLQDLMSHWGTQSIVQNIENTVYGNRIQTNVPSALFEFSLSVREIVLRILHSKQCRRSDGNEFLDHLVTHLWQITSLAQQYGRSDLADSSLHRLRSLLHHRYRDGLDSETLLRIRFEEALIMESKGNFSDAIRVMELLSSHLNAINSERGHLSPTAEGLYADALWKCGEWMSKYNIESSRAILHKYLMRASEIANSMYDRTKEKLSGQRFSSTHLSLAELVSSLYDNVNIRVSSQDWKKGGISVDSRKRKLQQCEDLVEALRSKIGSGKRANADSEEMENKCNELRSFMFSESREVDLITQEREKIEQSTQDLLRLAVESYSAALSIADTCEVGDMSKHVFRMVSLWFGCYRDVLKVATLSDVFLEAINKVPSYLFVPLTYQIFSRIGETVDRKSDEFQTILTRLVSRMCSEHPYHCLVQLIALSNGTKIGTGVSGRHADTYLENVGEAKVEAAKAIAKSLRKSEPRFISDLLDAYCTLTDAYIHLAMADTKQFHGVKREAINFSVLGKGDSRLDKCLGSRTRSRFRCPPCVLTKPPDIRPGGDYGNGLEDPIGSERVIGFQSRFSITETGIHRPKIVYCDGSKGGSFKQLVKGQDDIRQDAIMEQVFIYVNRLLKRRGAESVGRIGRGIEILSTSGNQFQSRALNDQLKVVTYNIIPLSPASGVLEWVDDTVPFGDYLIGEKGNKVSAHSKYGPGEWGNVLCRLHYNNAPSSVKREAFDEICKRFSPVFRYFFVERFSNSLQAWHAAKMKYTRSCAVSSMVGHMLGIGDRHSHNILVHERTGEVVHIDFGIVFEQGKTLPTPETVPFRLTRDIVDGMGPCGTKGTFSRAAEATTSVLRENASALLTILSAVVSDPLYKWSVSPVQARKRQCAATEDEETRAMDGVGNDLELSQLAVDHGNEAADRAISKIHEKLQGYEDGTSGERQSVEGQVQLLINSARDPDNLSVLFVGWGPWI